MGDFKRVIKILLEFLGYFIFTFYIVLFFLYRLQERKARLIIREDKIGGEFKLGLLFFSVVFDK